MSGTNAIKVVSTTPNSFDLGLDTLAVGPGGSPPPVPASTGPLGGWFRGFDTDTYNDTPTCGPGQSGATCQAVIQPLNTDGLLDTAGWRLLDDTQSAVWTTNGWVKPRPADRRRRGRVPLRLRRRLRGALHTLAQLTGPAPLLPRNVFGVWYSDYTPYSSNTIENTVYPEFVANHVPLNTLSLDTDWKAPNDWNGWEWNRSLFPSPSSFVALGELPWHRRDAEHPLEHRGQRPQAAAGRTHRGERPRLVQLHQRELQGVGLELHPPGRVQLRPPAELSAPGDLLLVARLVLRRLGRFLDRA